MTGTHRTPRVISYHDCNGHIQYVSEYLSLSFFINLRFVLLCLLVSKMFEMGPPFGPQALLCVRL